MNKLEKMEKVRSKYIKKIESIQNDVKDPNCPNLVKTQLNTWLNKAKPQLKELEQKIEIERMKVQ